MHLQGCLGRATCPPPAFPPPSSWLPTTLLTFCEAGQVPLLSPSALAEQQANYLLCAQAFLITHLSSGTAAFPPFAAASASAGATAEATSSCSLSPINACN